MADFIANATGNWSATATWAAVRNTWSIHATTNTTVTSGGVTSATFTAPNTTNYVVGVAVYISAVGTAGNLVCTLQENSIDTTATATVAITSLVTGGWMYFKFGTPYKYTATTAGYYRVKLNTSGASGTTSVASNSGATNFAYRVADDLVAAVPTTGDDILNAGNNLTALTVTIDDTSRLVGSGGTAATAPTARMTTSPAIYLSNAGTLAWSNSASSTLECKGHIEIASLGEVQMGTVASPISSSYIAKLIMNQNGTDTNYDINIEATGKWKGQGNSRTYWKTTYVSGTGVAASPLVTTDPVNWNVGDEICFTGQGAYNHNEKRFIITKNSSTSYVLSSTSGGAETALVNAHDSDDRIILLTRNVVVTTKTIGEAYCWRNNCTTENSVQVAWSRFEYAGGVNTTRRGIQVANGGATQTADFDYNIIYLPELYGVSWTTTTVEKTYTGIVVYGQSNTSNVASFIATSAKDLTFVDCFSIGCQSIGFQLTTCGDITLTRCESWNNNQLPNIFGGLYLLTSFSITFDDFVCQSTRTQGIYLAGCSNIRFINAQVGNYGTNTIDITCGTDLFAEVKFLNCNFGSATLISNYLNMTPGSEVRFDAINDTANNHRWYTPEGVNYATGAGLSDTTTVFTDHLSVRLSPENATTGCKWEFQVLARPGYYVSAQGLAKKNAAFGTDDLIVDLYLPDSTVANATVTMPDDTNSNPFNIGALYSGSVPRLATVRITAKSATASAYAYVGKLYNGTNELTALDTWSEGKPSQIMYPELGDPDSVWAVLTSGFTTTGTVGYLMTKLLTVAKFLGLK